MDFIVNLIPQKPRRIIRTARIYQLVTNGPWAHVEQAFSLVASTLVTPRRPRDYDIEAIRGAGNFLNKGDRAMLLRLFSCVHYLDFYVIPFVVVGYTAPAGSRQNFGALLLGAYAGAKLQYIGKVGTGFSEEVLANLFRKFKPHIRANPAVANAPREKNVTYLAPCLVAQISYGEWTNDQKLRQPVFLGLRDDKKPEEVTLPGQDR